MQALFLIIFLAFLIYFSIMKYIMDTLMYLGQRLKTLRIARCQSQQHISSSAHIAQTSLSNIEVGKFVPTDLNVRESIARQLGVTWDWLSNGHGLPFSPPSGIQLLNHCCGKKSESAAIELLLSLSEYAPGSPFFIDLTGRYLIFKLKSCFCFLFLASNTTDRRVMGIGKDFSSHGYVDAGLRFSFEDNIITYDSHGNAGLASTVTADYLTAMFDRALEARNDSDRIDSILNEVEQLIDAPEFVDKLAALIDSYKGNK